MENQQISVLYPGSAKPRRAEAKRKRESLVFARDARVGEPAVKSSDRNLASAIQYYPSQMVCFRTDERFTCRKFDCHWRQDCVKLIAVWKR